MGRGGGTFERLLDKATSQLLLETDWESILQICDMIRQGDTQAKYAVGAIKKKVNDKNPHVALYALEVLESVVKNCGQTVHDEVANKQTMEELKELLKRQVEANVRNKILYLIQAWAHAFRNEPKYKVVQDTYQIMKVEGHVFPEFKESDAMFAAERAPDWVDAEECHRCRVQFGVVTRKHHCRACGQIFCGKCSSKYSTIPKFGIEKEVRVCEPCYEHLNKKAEGKGTATTELPPEYLTSPLSQQSQLPPKRDETALQEEEELQLAIALSQSEAEEKRQKSTYSTYPKAEPTPVTSSAPPVNTLYSSPVNSSAPLAEDIDPELARYLNRNYWEKKQEEVRKSPTPSAPLSMGEPATQNTEVQPAPLSVVEQYQNGETDESHDQFLKALQNAVTTFVNRMKSNHLRGRSITNDSAVCSLFQSINSMHPQLLELLNQLDERRLYYEGLQDKLAQIRDARGALNALREEHREKLRRAAEEAERQRQIQLAQKLEIMRQKKQEYLEMQRQLAIQRLQEQEKERQLRLEQQKQTIQMRAQMPAFSLPYAQECLAERRSRSRPLNLCKRLQRLAILLIAWTLSLGIVLGCVLGVHYFSIYIYQVHHEKLLTSNYMGKEALLLALPLLVSLINLLIPYIYNLLAAWEKQESPVLEVYVAICRNLILKMVILGLLCYHWLSRKDTTSEMECWENFVGQELYRLVVMDFIFCLLDTFFAELMWRVILEKKLQSKRRPEFDIARNVLELIYGQTLTWLGVFFAPLLPVVQIFKLLLLFYIKKTSLMRNCQSPSKPWRASHMSTIFITLLCFPSFLGASIFLSYTIWAVKPSKICGPFRDHETIYESGKTWVLKLEKSNPNLTWFTWIHQHLIQNSFFLFLIAGILLAVIYLNFQVVKGQRKIITLLKEQIANEGEDKMFLIQKLHTIYGK